MTARARRIALAAFALAFASTVACIRPPQVPTAMPMPAGAPTATAAPYRIVPNDVLQIRFFYNKELNVSGPVRPDGYVTLDLVGDVMAAGRTPAELAAQLREDFAPHIPHPEVQVIVRDFAAQLVYVDGEVMTPGAVPIKGPLTALQAVASRGGAKNTASLGNAVLIRYVGTDEGLIQKVDLTGVLKGQAPDVLLQPYDVVFLPLTPIAQLNIWVEKYINRMVPSSVSFPFPYNLNTKWAVED